MSGKKLFHQMKKSKKPLIQHKLSPENYIRQRARTLPMDSCYVNSDWQEEKLANVIVSRRHINGNITACFYLVDLNCLGIKDSGYVFNETYPSFQEILEQYTENMDLIKIDYVLAHNIIYSGLTFAEEYGFNPHKDYQSVTRFMLDEDTDEIELLDIECGNDGKPVYIQGPHDDEATQKRVIAQLERTAGAGNYEFILASDYNQERNDYGGDENSDKDEGIDLDVEFGMNKSEAIEIIKKHKIKIKLKNKEDGERLFLAVDRLYEEFVDQQKCSELFEEFGDEFEIEIFSGEVTEEVLGLPKENEIHFKKLQKLFSELIFLSESNHKKAQKQLRSLMNEMPQNPALAFLELYLSNEKKKESYYEKLDAYRAKYPDYPLIRLNWLFNHATSPENDGKLEGLTDVFPGRKSIHSIEMICYLEYAVLAIVSSKDPNMLGAFYRILSEFTFSDDIHLPFLLLLFNFKLELVTKSIELFDNC